MPHTLESAKKKAKGIVKVQINTGKQDVFPGYDRAVLIYDENYKKSSGKSGFQMMQPMTKGIDEAMGSALKRYFYYRIKKTGFMRKMKTVELLHEAPPQSW